MPLLNRPDYKSLYTIAFYNLENLFDTEDDPKTLDDDFTQEGFNKWSSKRYTNKVYKLARTIAGLGLQTSKELPVLIGIAEVENKSVIQDLLAAIPLRSAKYSCIHFDSPDERLSSIIWLR